MSSGEDEDESDDESESTGIDLENATEAAQLSLDLDIPASVLVDTARLAETVREANRVVLESVDWQALSTSIDAYFEGLARTIANDIQGLEGPEDYEPDELVVSPPAERLAKHSIDNLLDELDSGGYSDLEEYHDRISEGRRHFEDEDYGAATFFFISVQDGLMLMLCNHFGFSTNSDGYYNRDSKVTAFAKAYDNAGYYGIDTGEIIPPYNNFYEHRNAIVHGSPNSAHLDRDIALLSMLFLMLTLDAAVSEMSQ